jgi:hypothetical protein
MKYLDRVLLMIVAYEWAGHANKKLVILIAIITGIEATVMAIHKADSEFFNNTISTLAKSFKDYQQYSIKRKKLKYENKLSKYRVDKEIANLEKFDITRGEE